MVSVGIEAALDDERGEDRHIWGPRSSGWVPTSTRLKCLFSGCKAICMTIVSGQLAPANAPVPRSFASPHHRKERSGSVFQVSNI